MPTIIFLEDIEGSKYGRQVEMYLNIDSHTEFGEKRS